MNATIFKDLKTDKIVTLDIAGMQKYLGGAILTATEIHTNDKYEVKYLGYRWMTAQDAVDSGRFEILHVGERAEKELGIAIGESKILEKREKSELKRLKAKYEK